MSISKGNVARIATAFALVGAITASALIGTAGAGPNDFVTNKALKKRVGAYSAFKNGPVDTNGAPGMDPRAFVPAGGTVASLALPKGKFAINAKLHAFVTTFDAHVACVLRAGGDFDVSAVHLEASNNNILPMALQVVHKFGPGPRIVTLNCSDSLSVGNNDTKVAWMKITAIEVPKLSNVASA